MMTTESLHLEAIEPNTLVDVCGGVHGPDGCIPPFPRPRPWPGPGLPDPTFPRPRPFPSPSPFPSPIDPIWPRDWR